MRRMVWQAGEGVAYEQQVDNGQKQGGERIAND